MKRIASAIVSILVSMGSCWGASLTAMPGIGGLQLGTVPPPGSYICESYFSYSSRDFRDRNGDKATVLMGHPVSFDVELYAELTSFQWVSPYKIFGANYGAGVVQGSGFGRGDLDFGEAFNIHGGKYGVIDTSIQPINLSWHWDRFDFSSAYSFIAPTGSFNPHDAVNIGRDRWNHIFSAGLTAYLDEEKSWSLALAPRYDIHMGQQHKDAHDGNDMALGWGIGKQWIFKNGEKTAPTGFFNVGPIGYALFQTTYNSGSAAIQKDVLPKVFAAGLEAKYTRVNWKGATFSIRFNKEFEASGRPQGLSTTCNFCIKF